MIDDLTSLSVEQLQARIDAAVAEQERRRQIGTWADQQAKAGEALRAIGMRTPTVTISADTLPPASGWLPGQTVTLGGTTYRQTCSTPARVNPGQTINPWEEIA